MARDTKKNAPYVVLIPRDSELLLDLQQEAATTGLTISQIIVVRLKDYYAMKHQPVPQQSLMPAAPMADQPQQPEETQESTQEEGKPVIDAATDAAMDAWL